MCDWAWKNNESIDTCGELAAALNCELTELVQYREPFDDIKPHDCLCNVDIKESCKKFGHRAYHDGAISWEIEEIGGEA